MTSLCVRPKMAAEKLGHLREVASEIGGKKRSQQAKNEMTFSQVINIADLRRLAQSRVPKVVFDYLDGGAEDEITLRENCRSFQDVTSRPRHAVAVGDCDLRTRVLGTEIAFPALLAPVGYSRLMHPGGEVAAARAAGQAGTGYILSTISGHKLEDVKAATSGPAWYQLYLLGGREAAEFAIERARKAGFTALVITIDTAVAGARERDPRNGMKELLAGTIFAKLPFLPQVLSRPGWLLSFLLDGGMPKLENIIVPGKGPMALMDISAALARAAVTWVDLGWIRKIWDGPMVVKGVLTADDARRAVDAGAAAIVVSNHGGRQLDCVSPTIRATAFSSAPGISAVVPIGKSTSVESAEAGKAVIRTRPLNIIHTTGNPEVATGRIASVRASMRSTRKCCVLSSGMVRIPAASIGNGGSAASSAGAPNWMH